MIGRHLALVKEIPTKRLFSKAAAARYLDIGVNMLVELTSSGEIKSYMWHNRRVYRLEDLDHYIESLKEWKTEHKTIKKGPEINVSDTQDQEH